MITTVGEKADFSGAKCRGNTRRGNGADRFAVGKPDRVSRVGASESIPCGPWNSGVPTPLALHRASGLLKQSNLLPPVGGFLPQQSRCD